MDDTSKFDPALRALIILARYHRIAVNPESIRYEFDIEGKGLTLTNWLLVLLSFAGVNLG